MSDNPEPRDQKIRPANADQSDPLRAERVRHEIRFRLLDVLQSERLTPHMQRITLGGVEIEGFYSPGFDDHVKLFFPAPGELAPARPEIGGKGLSFAEGVARPTVRDFTPRRHNRDAGTLEIDFALHESGPATEWARAARPGTKLGVAGPRGSFMLPTGFDSHLLIGDETALPAIARRLEELPPGTHASVLIEVSGPEDELPLASAASVTLHWVHRSAAAPGTDPLIAALSTITLPDGERHAWIGCESATAKALRQALIDQHGFNPKRIRASGYWRRGAVGVHDSFDE